MYLRSVEHRLQYRDDQQTHELPADPAERALLAEAMDASSLEDFERELAQHRHFVAETFAQVLGDAGSERNGGDEGDDFHVRLWEAPALDESTEARLREAGFDDPEALVAIMARTRASSRYLQLPAAVAAALRHAGAAVAGDGGGASGAVPTRRQVFARLLDLLETVAAAAPTSRC